MEHREPCPRCGAAVEYRLTAPGDDNRGFMYCGVDGALLEWSASDPVYRHLARGKPWELDGRQQLRVERGMRPCPCGGRFAFANPPRCPSCHASLRDLFQDRRLAAVLGTRFDADHDAIWAIGRLRRAWYAATSPWSPWLVNATLGVVAAVAALGLLLLLIQSGAVASP